MPGPVGNAALQRWRKVHHPHSPEHGAKPRCKVRLLDGSAGGTVVAAKDGDDVVVVLGQSVFDLGAGAVG